jgi:hypothetical protein
LRLARKKAGVGRPRHLILYTFREPSTVDVGRALHDAMDLERHAAFDLPSECQIRRRGSDPCCVGSTPHV